MKKKMYQSILVSFMLAIFLCGCSPKKMIEIAVEDFTEPSDHEYADGRMQELLAAIEEEDKEAIESLFSATAKEDIEDLDAEMEDLFAFIQGECISVDRDMQYVSEVNARWSRVETGYTLETTEETYRIAMIEQKKDRQNPENVGTLSIRAVKEEDQGSKFNMWENSDSPGIFVFGE